MKAPTGSTRKRNLHSPVAHQFFTIAIIHKERSDDTNVLLLLWSTCHYARPLGSFPLPRETQTPNRLITGYPRIYATDVARGGSLQNPV